MEAVDRRRRLAGVFAAYALVKTGGLFMDGYSFVAASLVSALLWIDWFRRSKASSISRRALGPAVLVGASLIAVVAYSLYVPQAYDQSPIGHFRAQGLDLVTLGSPSENVWLAASLGYDNQHFDLWGDGTNARWNYVGFACAALALFGAWTRRRDSRVAAIAIAGAIAFVISLGPALKFDVERPSGLSFENYDMPAGAAPRPPWQRAFTATPGIDQMRATYRWFGVTRMALVVLAGLAAATLLEAGGRRRLAALAVGTLTVVELAPNLPLLLERYRDGREAIQAVTREVGGDLRASTRRGDRVFFLNYDGTHNDWMVNYLAPQAGVRAYNVGGDKNLAIAVASWPREVQQMARLEVSAEDLVRAFETRRVDVVIAPYFHLRQATYAWPPPPSQKQAARRAFSPLLSDPRLRVEQRRWLAAIRPGRALAGRTRSSTAPNPVSSVAR